MRKVAAAFVLSALLAPAQTRDAVIRWQPTGGPPLEGSSAIIARRGGLLLAASGGWWRSPDGGNTWQRPGDRRTPWVFAASERAIFADTIDGILRSDDLGDSWTSCGAVPVTRRAGDAAASIAADEKRVYLALSRSLFRSDDECATWVRVEAPWDPAFSPALTADGSRVIVLTGGGSFISLDAGQTWRVVDKRLLNPVVFTTTCKGVILAGTGTGVFVSRDNGRSWVQKGLPGRSVSSVTAPRCGEIFAVAKDAGWTHSVFRSTDAGASWTSVNDGLTRHPIRLAAGEGGVYAVGSAGAFRWSNGRWRQFGPTDITVTSVVAASSGDLFAAAGTGLFKANEPAETWRRLLFGHDAHVSERPPSGGPVPVTLIIPKGDLLAATQAGVVRSRDCGRTWRFVGLSRAAHSLIATATGALLAGTENGIFHSGDDGESWGERSMGLTTFHIYALAVASDGTIYAGTREGEVFRSTDEGDRWRPMSGTRRETPVHALLPLKNGDVLAGGSSGLWRWNRTGRSWASVPLPTPRRTALVRTLLQDMQGVMFAGTDGDGMFASFDEGITWCSANEGLSVNRVFSLGMDTAGRLLAGTSAGVFRGEPHVEQPRRLGAKHRENRLGGSDVEATLPCAPPARQ